MTRTPLPHLVAVSLMLGVAAVTTGCSTMTTRSTDTLAETIAAAPAHTLAAADLFGLGSDERFLVACPYETAASVSQRTELPWADAPDYSTRDDVQALVIVGDDAPESQEFPRDGVDLCAEGEWLLSPGSTRLTFIETDDGWALSSRS